MQYKNGQFCSVPQAHWVHLNKCITGFQWSALLSILKLLRRRPGASKLMSPTMMRNSKSMKPTYKTLIIKVRIMIPTIKIKTKATIIIIIPAAAPATQELDITSTTTAMEHPTIPRATSRISQPMCKYPSLDQ